jgi:5-methyltetrahydrofolate--homocysteine methyltransferase
MTSAIMNPCRPQEMEAVRGANVLTGADPNCGEWIMTYRDHKPGADGAVAATPASGGRRGGREGRRRAQAS